MQLQTILLKPLFSFFLQTAPPTKVVAEITKPIDINQHKILTLFDGWKEGLINFGIRVLLAIVFFFVARWLISSDY